MPPTIQISVRLDEQVLKVVDRWRREQEHPPSRPEAIRALLNRSLSGGASHPTQPTHGRSQATEYTVDWYDALIDKIEAWLAQNDDVEGFSRAVVYLVDQAITNEIPEALKDKARALDKTIPELVEWAIERLEDES